MTVPAKSVDDWSDSEEEDERSDVETSVLLGIPDGEIEKQEDISDAAVSRIGGHPVRLFIYYMLCTIDIYNTRNFVYSRSRYAQYQFRNYIAT